MELLQCNILITNASGSGFDLRGLVSSASITHRSIFLMKSCHRNSTGSVRGNLRRCERAGCDPGERAPRFLYRPLGVGSGPTRPKTVSHTRSFLPTQMIGERFRNGRKSRPKSRDGHGAEAVKSRWPWTCASPATGKAIFGQPEVAVGLEPGRRLHAKIATGSSGGGAPWRCWWGAMIFPAELAERYGYINRALPVDELTPSSRSWLHRIASFSRAYHRSCWAAAVDAGRIWFHGRGATGGSP